jgi:hypothetical protein
MRIDEHAPARIPQRIELKNGHALVYGLYRGRAAVFLGGQGRIRSLFRQDERFLHDIVIASGTSGWMANDVFGYRGIATGDAVKDLVETDFRPLGLAMLTAANEHLSFEQCGLIDKYDVGVLRVWLEVSRLSSNPNKRGFYD